MPKIKVHVAEYENGRTMILHEDRSKPELVELTLRQATSSPTRIKATLTAALAGEDHDSLPLPFAEAHFGQGYTPEFRLEMN